MICIFAGKFDLSLLLFSLPFTLAILTRTLFLLLFSYYTPDRDCGNRDFISTLYSVSALPVVGLFALNQTRLWTVFGIVVWVSLVAGLILSDHVSFIRNMLNVMLFQGFILFAHYRRELADRRMYTLRAELKGMPLFFFILLIFLSFFYSTPPFNSSTIPS